MRLRGSKFAEIAGSIRLVIFIQLVCSTVGLVLSAISLFSGQNRGFMEDYAVLRINTTLLGQELFSLGEEPESKSHDGSHDGGLFGIKDKWDDMKENGSDKISDIVGDAAKDVADAFGVSDWYSLHLLNTCEGDFEGDDIASKTFNATKCAKNNDRFNLNKLLKKSISSAPIDIQLDDIDWSDKIQKSINKLNKYCLALSIMYALALGLSGVSVPGYLLGLRWPENKRLNSFSLPITLLAAVLLCFGSILISATVSKGVDEINDLGAKAGVKASGGHKFEATSWCAAGVMITASVLGALRYRSHRHAPRTL